MEHPAEPVDLNELRKVFIDRVIPPHFEERLLDSRKLRRALLELTTQDEVHRFIKNGQMSSRLRSRLLNEAPVTSADTSADKTTPKPVFTAKRTFPQRSVLYSSGPTQKPIDSVGNQPVVSTTPTQSQPANVVSNVPQVPSRNISLHNISKQVEGSMKSLKPTSQLSRPPAAAAAASIPERAPQQPKLSPLLDPRISNDQGKGLKRKQDDNTPTTGVSSNSHPQKSRRLDSTELLVGNCERSVSKGNQVLDTRGSSSIPSNPGHDHLTSTEPQTSEDADESDDDILLYRMTRPGKVSKSGWNYRVWTFPSGETQPTSGALLLKGYTLHDNPAAQWICPIRSCRILFTRLEGLGAHFNTVHRASLLNDNDDGTLSIVKKVEADGIIMPAKVVSRKPLDPGESPLKEPSFSKPAMVASYQTPSTSAILGANTLISEDDIGKVGMALWKYVQGHLINTPLSPIPQSNDVRMLLKYMVHIRDVVWNTKIQTKFREADAKYISAIILQVAGQKAQAPCDKCMEGKGPFQGCFVLPPNAPWSLRQLITGCANCHYKNKHSQCSLSISSRKANLELEQSEKLPEGSSHKKKKAIQPRGPSLSGSSHEQNLISNPPNGINMTSTSTANLAQMLGLEAWEIAPGRISDEQSDSVDNFAFSNSYMAQNQAVRIGHGVSFQVITIKPGTVHYWSASANKIRICSVASGKLQISIHGQEFSIGPNGMVRIRPGVECTAVNKLYMDATVHVTTLPGDVCG